MLIPIEKLVRAKTLYAFSFSVLIASNRSGRAIHCPTAVPDCPDRHPRLFPGHHRPNRLSCSCTTMNAAATISMLTVADLTMATGSRWCLSMSCLQIIETENNIILKKLQVSKIDFIATTPTPSLTMYVILISLDTNEAQQILYTC